MFDSFGWVHYVWVLGSNEKCQFSLLNNFFSSSPRNMKNILTCSSECPLLHSVCFKTIADRMNAWCSEEHPHNLEHSETPRSAEPGLALTRLQPTAQLTARFDPTNWPRDTSVIVVKTLYDYYRKIKAKPTRRYVTDYDYHCIPYTYSFASFWSSLLLISKHKLSVSVWTNGICLLCL